MRTIIIAAGRGWGEARSRVNEATACVVRHIGDLGLKVVPQKTEVIYFHNGRRGAPPKDTIMVSGVPVPIGPHPGQSMVFPDPFRGFGVARREGGERPSQAAPQSGGTKWPCSPPICGGGSLHRPVVALVWAAEARASRRIYALLHRVQRRVAIRVIKGYRTISHAAATALAGQSLELLASEARSLLRVGGAQAGKSRHSASLQGRQTG